MGSPPLDTFPGEEQPSRPCSEKALVSNAAPALQHWTDALLATEPACNYSSD